MIRLVTLQQHLIFTLVKMTIQAKVTRYVIVIQKFTKYTGVQVSKHAIQYRQDSVYLFLLILHYSACWPLGALGMVIQEVVIFHAIEPAKCLTWDQLVGHHSDHGLYLFLAL